MRLLLAALLLLLVLPAQAQQGLSKALVVSSCGTETVAVGGVVQPTMDTTGRLCSHKTSGGGTGCSQATAYLARATGEVTHAADLTTLICGLVADGVWAKIDALYVLAQQNQTDALLNLVSTSYTATVVTAGTFTIYRGLTAFSWNTGFNPITATSPHYTQNAATIGAWTSGQTENLPQMGNDAVGATTGLFTCYAGNLFYARINNASITSVPSPSTSALYVGDRESSAGVDPFINGVDEGLLTGVSGAPFNGPFYVGNTGGGSTVTSQTLAAAFIGGSLGATLQLALYTRLRTYMTSIGVP